jgi:hypothetical protein
MDIKDQMAHGSTLYGDRLKEGLGGVMEEKQTLVTIPYDWFERMGTDLTSARAAIADMAAALEPSATPSGPDFLDWIANRLVNVYGESENVDFVLALRRKANAARATLDKHKGEIGKAR